MVEGNKEGRRKELCLLIFLSFRFVTPDRKGFSLLGSLGPVTSSHPHSRHRLSLSLELCIKGRNGEEVEGGAGFLTTP